MQATSALYKSIIAGVNHWFETKLTIDGVGDFDETQLFSVETDIKLFDGSPKVGGAVSGQIKVKMLLPNSNIPKMAVLRPFARVCNATQQSEWLPQGVFYIDTRENTKNYNGLDVLTLTGYDAMMFAERDFHSETITGDSTDTDMVDEIASAIGVSVDSRTYAIMTSGYTVPLPTGYTYREVLGHIASMYAGCFVMTDEGKLRLVTILELPEETNYLIDNAGNAITFGGVRILL